MRNIFDKHYKRYDAWYDKNRFVYLSEQEVLKKILPKKGDGLEVGVGTGRFASPLGIRTGVDLSGSMIQIAKRRGVNVCQANGESLPFKDRVFDYALIVITLCFVKSPLKLLKETRRVLKKDGKIIIGIVDRYSFLGKFYMVKKSFFYKYARFFSVKKIVSLLKIAGFNRFLFYQTLYGPLEEISSAEKPKKGFGEGGFVTIGAYKV